MSQEIDTLIKDLIYKTSFEIEGIDVMYDEDTGSYWYHIKSPDSRLMIGKNGETLMALNHLVKKAIEQKFGEQKSTTEYFVDINYFQKKKIDNLKQIAHMMAERARFFKSSVEVDPMSPYDRKIIHMYLANKSDLATESSGEGMNRHVVIKYIGGI